MRFRSPSTCLPWPILQLMSATWGSIFGLERQHHRAQSSSARTAAGVFFRLFGAFWILGHFLLVFVPEVESGLVLNEFIRHFEPCFYDETQLRSQHERVRRGASSSPEQQDSSLHDHHVKLEFTAHNRRFKVRLKPNAQTVFAPDVVIEKTGGGAVEFDFDRIYVGHLEDDDDASVSGIMTRDGLFDGSITTRNDVYYIEPASRYLPTADFHSVIYRESDVDHPSTAAARRHRLYTTSVSSGVPKGSSVDDVNNIHDDKDGLFFEGDRQGRNSASVLVVQSSGVGGSPYYYYSLGDNGSTVSVLGSNGSYNRDIKEAVRAEALKAVLTDANNSSSPDDNSDPPLIRHGDAAEYRSSGTNGGSPPTGTLWLNYDSRGAMSNSPHQPPVIINRDLTFSAPGSQLTNTVDNVVSSDLLVHYVRPGADEFRYRRKPAVFSKKKYDPSKTTCMLYLQADHLFYNMMGSEEACIESMTRHVQRVNSIYEHTDFDEDGKPDQVSFMIKRIKVHTNEAVNEADYRYPGNYGVEKFLELFSEEDYDSFCLAYMFTYRDFEGGTLGLAWTGDLKNAGGVCERNGHYRGSLKSLNTGIITLLNYGKRVPPAVSHVTLAHEIGHNFGSPHDPEHDKLCTPGGHDGNYIMFARATSGDKKNNKRFSPCSIKAINGVLNEKARGKNGCFEEPATAICGNGVVEAGEECDCGWEEDCLEECCWPMRKDPLPLQKPCTLKPYKICSPSQGPCCTQDCRLQIGNRCRDDNGCRDASYCDGRTAHCPASVNKANKTVCNEEFVCFKGECTGSICTAYGLESCQCIRGPLDPPTKSCELCCKLPGPDSACLSSFDWNIPPYDVPDMYAKPGTPCDNYNGYCDVFQKCREVDPSGPLSTLRKLILSDESIASLRRWASEHWYGVLFIFLGFAVMLFGIAKLFGKSNMVYWKKITVYHGSSRGHSKSRNKLQTAITTAANNNQLVVHPTVVRTKIPLRKKVREKGHRKHRNASPRKKAASAQNASGAVVVPTAPPDGTALVPTTLHERPAKKVMLFKKSRGSSNSHHNRHPVISTPAAHLGIPSSGNKFLSYSMKKVKKGIASPTGGSPKKSKTAGGIPTSSSIVATKGRSLLNKAAGHSKSGAKKAKRGAENQLSKDISSEEPKLIPPPLPPRNPPNNGDLSLNIKQTETAQPITTSAPSLPSGSQEVTSASQPSAVQPSTTPPSTSSGARTRRSVADSNNGGSSANVSDQGNAAEVVEAVGNCIEPSSSADRITEAPVQEAISRMSTFDRLKSRSFSPENVRRKRTTAAGKTAMEARRKQYYTARNIDSWLASAVEATSARSAARSRPERPYSDIILDIEPTTDEEDFCEQPGLNWTPSEELLEFPAPGATSASMLNLLSDAELPSSSKASSIVRPAALMDKMLGVGKYQQYKSKHPSKASMVGHKNKGSKEVSKVKSKQHRKPKLTIKYENEVCPSGYRRQASAPALAPATTEHELREAILMGSKCPATAEPSMGNFSFNPPVVSSSGASRPASYAESKREKFAYSRQSSAPTPMAPNRRTSSSAAAMGVSKTRKTPSSRLSGANRKSESFHLGDYTSSSSTPVSTPPAQWTDAVLDDAMVFPPSSMAAMKRNASNPKLTSRSTASSRSSASFNNTPSSHPATVVGTGSAADLTSARFRSFDELDRFFSTAAEASRLRGSTDRMSNQESGK